VWGYTVIRAIQLLGLLCCPWAEFGRLTEVFGLPGNERITPDAVNSGPNGGSHAPVVDVGRGAIQRLKSKESSHGTFG